MKKRILLTCSQLLTEDVYKWLVKNFELMITGCMVGEKQLQMGLAGARLLIMGGAEFITRNIDKENPGLLYVFIGIEARTSFDSEVWDRVVREGRIFVTGGGQTAVAETTFEQMRCFSDPHPPHRSQEANQLGWQLSWTESHSRPALADGRRMRRVSPVSIKLGGSCQGTSLYPTCDI